MVQVPRRAAGRACIRRCNAVLGPCFQPNPQIGRKKCGLVKGRKRRARVGPACPLSSRDAQKASRRAAADPGEQISALNRLRSMNPQEIDRNARIAALVATDLTPMQRRLYQYERTGEALINDTRTARRLGVAEAELPGMRQALDYALTRGRLRFEEGLSCRAHLGSPSWQIQEQHIELCSFCAATARLIAENRPLLRKMVSAELLAVADRFESQPNSKPIAAISRVLRRLVIRRRQPGGRSGQRTQTARSPRSR